MDIRQQLEEPSGVLRAWLIRRSAYALLCGVFAGTICWGTGHFNPGWLGETLGAVFTGVAVVVIIHVGFRMGRRTSTQMLDRVSACIEAEAESFKVPQISVLGWAPYDRLVTAMQSLMTKHLERFQQCDAERMRYQRLAEDSPGLEVCWDAHGVLWWMNAAASRRFASSAERPGSIDELVDRWVYPKDRSMLREHIAKAQQGLVRSHVEARFFDPAGAFSWGLCQLTPSRGEREAVAAVRLSVQDIQGRKEAETRLIEMVAALQRAQALKEHYLGRSNDEKMRLSALLDLLGSGVLFVDSDRRVTGINQAAARLWGIENSEAVIGMRDTAVLDLSAALRMDDAAYREHISGVVASAQRSLPYDIWLCDGRVVCEQTAPVFSADNRQLVGRVWIFDDVTETRRTPRGASGLIERDFTTYPTDRRGWNPVDTHAAVAAAELFGDPD